MKQKFLISSTLLLLICCILCCLKCCKKSPCDLPAPSSINVEPQDEATALVTWSLVAGAQGYQLEVKEVYSNNVVLDTFLQATDTTYLASGLATDTKYKATVTPACSENSLSPCNTSIIWMQSLDWIIGDVVVMSPGGTNWQGMDNCDCRDPLTGATTLSNGSSWSIPSGGNSRQIFLANINGSNQAQFKFAYDSFFDKVIVDNCNSEITVQKLSNTTLGIFSGANRQAYMVFNFFTNSFIYYTDGCAGCSLHFIPCHSLNASDDPVPE